MRARDRLGVLNLIPLILFAAATTVAREFQSTSTDERTAAIVERASRYVEEYERAFAALVSEEQQVQTLVRADGSVRQTRELRSEFLLIKSGPEWALVFRDVIEVDRQPVRDRADRLHKLFLDNPKTALEQARAIARESERHNIGVNRTGNSPLVPLIFLHPKELARSRFAMGEASLTFSEFQRPSRLRTRRGSTTFDLPARGSFEVDTASGRVLAAEFSAAGPPGSYSTSLAVKFADDPRLKLMVPTAVRERYWFADKRDDDRLEVVSNYSNFRRLQVGVGEQIKPPS